MVYKTGLVASVKCNGRILREEQNNVYLPFNCDYSILLKNLETRKCVVTISIDGQDILNNQSLLLNPNQDIELKGFLEKNIVKNKFKFIERTEEISNYRGERIDDGMIRIEYQFESICSNYNFYQSPLFRQCGAKTSDATHDYRMVDITCQSSQDTFDSFCSAEINPGITVKGGETNQHFNYGSVNNLEDSKHVIILKLCGFYNQEKLEKPITIQTKKQCPTCGKRAKSNIKFCSNCGTFLKTI